MSRQAPSATSSALAWTVVSNVALPLSALLTGPILARALNPTGRGELAAVLAPIALIVLVLNFGVPESLTYHVASRRIATDAAVRLGLVLGVGCGVLAGLVIAALTPVILASYPHVHGLSYALAATLPVLMGFGMWRNVAQGAQRFDLPNHERWFGIAMRLPLLAAFALAGSLTVTAAAWFTHGTAVVATVMLFPIARGAWRSGRARVARDDVRAILRYGMRTWSGTLGYIMLLRIDQVLIAPLGSARQLGLYAVAAGVADFPAVAFAAVRDVMFATSAERSDPSLSARATRAVVALLAPVCIAFALLAPLVVPLLFGRSFSDAVPASQLLVLAAVPGGVDVVLGSGLLAAGRPGVRSVVQVSAAALLVVGLFVLVPSHGAVGGATAALVARLFGAALTVVATVRTTSLSPWECFVPRRADARDVIARIRALLRR
jgi:O-antigen/teichoic acid export membrane protein